MNTVVPFPSTAEGTACVRLYDRITRLIETTIEENPDMLSVTVLGVLKLVETNFIARMP